MIIGNQFGEDRVNVCGAAVTFRAKKDRVEIWTRVTDAAPCKRIAAKIGEVVEFGRAMDFMSHQAAGEY